jgi:hypothetical protein
MYDGIYLSNTEGANEDVGGNSLASARLYYLASSERPVSRIELPRRLRADAKEMP